MQPLSNFGNALYTSSLHPYQQPVPPAGNPYSALNHHPQGLPQLRNTRFPGTAAVRQGAPPATNPFQQNPSAHLRQLSGPGPFQPLQPYIQQQQQQQQQQQVQQLHRSQATAQPPRPLSSASRASQPRSTASPFVKPASPPSSQTSSSPMAAASPSSQQRPQFPLYQAPTTPEAIAREQERVTLLLSINNHLLKHVSDLQGQGQGGVTQPPQAGDAAPHPPKQASPEYVSCMRAIQANIAWCGAVANANSGPPGASKNTPIGPAVMTCPVQDKSVREMYEKLAGLFPGWKGMQLGNRQVSGAHGQPGQQVGQQGMMTQQSQPQQPQQGQPGALMGPGQGMSHFAGMMGMGGGGSMMG